jgi:uncharacterized protein (TIGR02594 family)
MAVTLSPIALPRIYDWLYNEPGPKMILEFIKLYGIEETEGAGDNPVILGWARDLELREYNHDSIAWCGLLMAKLAHEAGKPFPKDPLWAYNWSRWGTEVPLDQILFGDVCVASRPGGNHVFLNIGEDTQCYHGGAGNQGNRVSIARILKGRVFSARRLYSIGMPANVRKVILHPNGHISENEV